MTGMILDAVLMLLLVAALGYGVRLEKKLTQLRAGPISLTRGRMGRRNQSIAVRCEAPLTPHAKQALQRLK